MIIIAKGCVTSFTKYNLIIKVKGRIRDSNSGQGTPQVLTLPTELKLPLTCSIVTPSLISLVLGYGLRGLLYYTYYYIIIAKFLVLMGGLVECVILH